MRFPWDSRGIGVFLLLACAVFAGAPVRAQSLDLSGRDGAAPIAIDARGGIEWNRDAKLFIAKGPNATATQGELVVDADELRAYYRDGAAGGSEIYRLDAIGRVRITQPGRVATGGHAIYDVDKAVVVLKDGDPIKLTAGADVITARRQLEFWQDRQLAVARGDATAVRADRRVRADVLTAHFAPGPDGRTRVELVEAFDNVRIDTAQDQVFADRAAYNVPTGLARLTGSVKIKRDKNVINGCSADIDLNTGVSRMNSCGGAPANAQTAPPRTKQGSAAAPSDRKPARVHGVLVPNSKTPKEKTPNEKTK